MYILYGKSLMKYTGWCQNDFNFQSYLRPVRRVHRPRVELVLDRRVVDPAALPGGRRGDLCSRGRICH
jgi:hypothetical protein